IAILAGFCIDFAGKKLLPQSMRGGYAGNSEEVDCHAHDEQDGILLAAVKHTLHIFVYILIFNAILGGVVAFVGADTLGAFVTGSGYWQPVLAGLVGLIPNCAASVLLTQLFAAGQLSFGGLVSGLCTGAGVGLAVLLHANKSMKQNMFIIVLLYVIGVFAGTVVQLFA
ncbi:MAG: arsenic efflux protein, partial [Ruthenibacterium sp.]